MTKALGLKAFDVWRDSGNNIIHAHGGYIFRYEGMYYWYGEYKVGETRSISITGTDGKQNTMMRSDFAGISCYRSADLNKWEFRGLAVSPSSGPGSDLMPSRVVERPRVLYNPKTHRFVMLLHIDDAGYGEAKIGFAVNDRPDGPFTYLRSVRPCGEESRDFTVFQDDDGTAWLYHSSEGNRTLHMSGFRTIIFPPQKATLDALRGCYARRLSFSNVQANIT